MEKTQSIEGCTSVQSKAPAPSKAGKAEPRIPNPDSGSRTPDPGSRLSQ